MTYIPSDSSLGQSPLCSRGLSETPSAGYRKDPDYSLPEPAVTVRGLGKCYAVYPNPADRLKQALMGSRRQYYREVWALRNITLEIPRGTTVGLIGRNGSGKSTFLQLICGTLTPTTGEIEVRGRIAALLELGAGFNPEFTGRENVHLNAAILGLSSAEIAARYDEIVDFSEIGEFIDQPVKTYSSGMFIRLAFAVATSADPDILVVDEALAVGDEAFQRKCFARLHRLKQRGGTILFVSHSSTAVVELCDTAHLLDRGELLVSGQPKQVVAQYFKLLSAPAEKSLEVRESIRRGDIVPTKPSEPSTALPTAIGDIPPPSGLESFDPDLRSTTTIAYVSHGATIEHPHLTTPGGSPVNVLAHGSEYLYRYTVHFSRPAWAARFGMMIKTVSGLELGGGATSTIAEAMDVDEGTTIHVQFRFRCRMLPGVYFLNAGVEAAVDGERRFLHRLVDALMFRVMPQQDLTCTGLVDLSVEPSIQVRRQAA